MPSAPPILPGGSNLNVTGVVQGAVIGDNNRVSLHFTRHESFVPREAPPLPAHWIERESLVSQAVAPLKDPGAGAVVALVGMGGSGKSNLGARVAQAVASTFTRGCFWIDTATSDPDDVLLRMALAFGHDISALTSREARANTVRSLLAGQPVLLVLDDVWDVAATSPFLPLAPGCAAIVTTRNDAIAANIGTHVVTIDRLTTAEGVALLKSVATSADRVDPQLAQITESLGGLPLALELAAKLARQQNRRPGFSWPQFAAEFTTSTKRLGLGPAGATVRTAFDATWTRALDAGSQRAFAQLGLFQAGDISTAEAAAAWDAATEPALERINTLLDLSLVQLIDTATLRLHPLLSDYAAEKAEGLPADERVAAHQRVADRLFERAPDPPRTMIDLRYVLRSHWHAGAAGDRVRGERVYPWFGKGQEKTAVPGFLIDRGQPRTRARHERIEWELLKGASLRARVWASYRLGEALADAGELLESRHHLEQAVSMMESPELDDRARSLGLSKFLMSLGHVRARLGDLDGAVAAMRRMIEMDRKAAERGGITGAHASALIGLLQLGDLIAQTQRGESESEAIKIYEEVYAEALQTSGSHEAVMACERLAQHAVQSQPKMALKYIREARQLGEQFPRAFGGRQGARYARLLGTTAVELACNGQPALEDALALFTFAIENAEERGAQTEKGYSLYALGNFFEHYHILDREPPLAAAWACYALSNLSTAEHEDGSPLNTQQRIEDRLIPRIPEAERSAIAAAVTHDPWALINAALAPFQITRSVSGADTASNSATAKSA